MISTNTTTGQKIHISGYPGMEVDLGGVVKTFSDEEFLDFCRRHPDARIERESNGEISIMAPTSSETGRINFDLSLSLGIWSRKDATGKAFDSSTGFTLPNNAIRSPDVSWISSSRWNTLSDEDRSGFARICPDFVVELRSETDPISKLQQKMEEYMENGALLGWLIDPISRTVHIYRPDTAPEILSDPSEISGESVLTGFVLYLNEVWN